MVQRRPAPRDLGKQVHELLRCNPELPWDAALLRIVASDGSGKQARRMTRGRRLGSRNRKAAWPEPELSWGRLRPRDGRSAKLEERRT
jgi:hypothetical protein